ncbi:hypothetical protein DMI70_23305 [Escherichia coli]|nr:hypothetical protein [Escherichia coli]
MEYKRRLEGLHHQQGKGIPVLDRARAGMAKIMKSSSSDWVLYCGSGILIALAVIKPARASPS